MANYLGNQCPVCNKKFSTGDDIVVCPICGAPHHRECYGSLNHCAFEADHISGKAWKSATPVTSSEGDAGVNPQNGEQWQANAENVRTCQVCGSKNPKDNIFCCSCGNKLTNSSTAQEMPRQFNSMFINTAVKLDPAVAVYGGVTPTEKIGDYSARELAVLVGRSSAHYLPIFKDESESEKKISINFSALLFGPIYFFYRKMNKIGVVFLAFILLAMVPRMLYISENMPIMLKESVGVEALEEAGVDITALLDGMNQQKLSKYEKWSRYSQLLQLGTHLVAALLGNKLYYAHSMKKMKEIKEKEAEGQYAVGAINHEKTLQQAGGINTAVAPIFAGIIFFFSVGMFLYINLVYFTPTILQVARIINMYL